MLTLPIVFGRVGSVICLRSHHPKSNQIYLPFILSSGRAVIVQRLTGVNPPIGLRGQPLRALTSSSDDGANNAGANKSDTRPPVQPAPTVVVDSGQNVKIKELISGLSSEERHILYHTLRNVFLEEEWQRERGRDQANCPSNPVMAWLWRGTHHFRTYIQSPTRKQLANLFLYHSLPYVAFGTIDNSLMLLGADYIDYMFGDTLGLSSLASAALGNTFADAFSIALAYQVERFFSRLVPGPSTLTLGQYELRRTRITIQLARVIGIAIGCLIGMTPLLFINVK